MQLDPVGSCLTKHVSHPTGQSQTGKPLRIPAERPPWCPVAFTIPQTLLVAAGPAAGEELAPCPFSASLSGWQVPSRLWTTLVVPGPEQLGQMMMSGAPLCCKNSDTLTSESSSQKGTVLKLRLGVKPRDKASSEQHRLGPLCPSRGTAQTPSKPLSSFPSSLAHRKKPPFGVSSDLPSASAPRSAGRASVTGHLQAPAMLPSTPKWAGPQRSRRMSGGGQAEPGAFRAQPLAWGLWTASEGTRVPVCDCAHMHNLKVFCGADEARNQSRKEEEKVGRVCSSITQLIIQYCLWGARRVPDPEPDTGHTVVTENCP